MDDRMRLPIHPDRSGRDDTRKQFGVLRRLSLAALVFGASLVMSAQPATSQVQIIVNGDPITAYDIEQRSRLVQLSTRKTPTRKEVVDELIDEKLKLNVAKL